MTTTTERRGDVCDVCGQFDTDPRHVQSVPQGTADARPSQEFLDGLPDGLPARAIATLVDPTTVSRHMDCCASKGCTVCSEVVTTTGGATGDELLTKIVEA